jgi:hypothetical protein
MLSVFYVANIQSQRRLYFRHAGLSTKVGTTLLPDHLETICVATRLQCVCFMRSSASLGPSLALIPPYQEFVAKKMCHQRGGLRPHQQEKQLLQLNYIILWISNSIELHLFRVCAHTNIFYVIDTHSRTVVSAAHGRTVFSKTSSCTSLRMNARACTPESDYSEFSDPENTALHSQKYRSSKIPDRQSIRKYNTTWLHCSCCTSPT